MNLKQLECFVSVAKLGSFSKAAVALGIAQPALNRQLRALEVGLRETLLLRNGRGVTLTPAGQRLFEHSVGDPEPGVAGTRRHGGRSATSRPAASPSAGRPASAASSRCR